MVRQLENSKTGFTLQSVRINSTYTSIACWPVDPALKQPALTKRDLLRYFAQVSAPSCRIRIARSR